MSSIGGHHSPKAVTHDWITPQFVLNALGRFDLDPCASLRYTLREQFVYVIYTHVKNHMHKM